MSNRRSTRALVPASRRRRGVAARLLALAMAVTLARIPLSAADPADIQAVPAPQLGSDPPKATPIGAGDASVSTSTGALTYSYPITAPAGRHDLAPALALTYSSQGAIYGGLAAGWSLDLPFIEEDGDARHRRHLTTAPQHQVESPADDVFVSGLAGGRRLLPTSEAAPAGVGFTYRADRDSSQLRYQRMDLGQSPAPSFHWRVQAPDGTSHYFGDAAFITQPGSTALRAPSAWKVPLTRTVDPFGNTVEYHWKYDIDVDSQEGQEYRIDKIRYTSNPSAGQGHHAEVSFVWSRPTSPLCNRWVGLQLDFRLGSRWAEGTYQLDEVVAKAVAPVGGAVQHTRTITLGYDARTSDCNDPFTPYRQLTSISERAVGASTAAQPLVVLPTVTFGYGSAEVRRVVAKPVSLAALPKLASGTRGKLGPGAWPGVESMLLDFDGDGRPDLLEAKHTDPGQCQMTWKRNLGSTGGAAPTFAAAQTLTLPRLPWGGTTMGVANPAMGPQEGCFLNFQLTNYWNKADNVLCEAVVNGTPAPHNMYKQPTYLAYRWVDMNADGRPDLVTAIHHDPFYFDPSAQPWFGSYPACGSTGGACPMVPDACMATAVACNDPGKVCSWNDPVLRGCVDPAPTEACGLMGQRDNTWVPPGGPPTLEVTDDDPPASSDCPPTEQVGHKLACKEYPWFVYWNNGNGQLNPNPEIKLQPGPLESDSGDSSFGGSSGFAAGKHALQDFDGDGTLDLAMSAAHANTIAGEPSAVDAQYWLLFPGTRTGGFERASNGKHVRFEVLTRPGLPTSGGSGIRIGGTNPRQFEATTAGQIIDLNGDGLPDYVGYIANAYRVFYGDGGRMRMIAGGSGGERDLDLAGAFLSSSLTVATTGGWTPPPVAAFQLDDRIKDGSRYATHRLIDLDADGRPDHVSLSDLNALPVIRWNIGDGFLGTSTTGSADLGRALRNKATLVDGTTPTWSTSSDLVDLDGDGLSEIVDLAGLADGANRKVHDLADPASGGAPPRLLRWIGNGRGATTTVSYAAMTDATVVLMDPAATPNPKVSPNAQWVVSALTTTEQLTALPQSATTSTVSYRYDHPRYGADNDGKRGFRGFEQTRTIGPTGAVSVDRFAYDIDKTGLKTMTLVYPSPNIGTPGAPSSPQSFVHAIDETTYNEMVPPVLGVKVVLPTTTRKRLCQPNQTEAQCLAAPASLVKTASTWTGLSSSSTGGPALLYAMTQQRVQSAEAQAPTDRIAVTDYYLAADGDLFRLRTTSTHADTGAGVTFARTVTTWDTPLYRAPVTQEVWFDQNGSGRAITRFDVDALGNVRKRWKPEQEAAGPPAVYEFDPSGRFVTHEVNEVGHDFVTTYEPGTGAVVSKQGTNFRTCDVTANCPALWQRVRDEVWTKVDGVGRPLEQRETYANGTTYYLEYLTKTWSYTEPASSCVTVGGVCTAPPVVSAGASVTERSLIEWTETRFAETRTELDGHGRPLRSTAEAGTNDAVSSFAYDSAGKLIRVRLPNPALAAGTPGTVDYRYGFDSLGRPVSMRRPDAAEIDQSGVDVAYAGLVETRSDVAGAGGGAVGKTRLTRDAFGRLTQVEELRSIVNNVEAWATTEYQYDPADRVVLVREVAEDVQTSMVHDWGGRRTRISRSGRNWDFVYDRNGNVLAEVAPPDSSVPGQAPSAQDIARWTTTFVYDAHDRPISKVMAQRAIPDTLKATLGIGTWTYQWDLAGMNRKGQLYLARLMIPGTNVPYFSDSFGYDAQGNITAHNDRTWFGHVTPGGAQPTTAQQPVRAFGEHFTPGGQSRRVIYGDWLATDGTNNGQYTQSVTLFDDRGLPLRTDLYRTGSGLPTVTLGTQTRNVAGMVTRRLSDQAGMGLAMTKIQSDWLYDELGRIKEQVISRDAASTLVAHQKLTYWGADDPKQLRHKVGAAGTERVLDYAYDPRHQLTGAVETGAGAYSGTFSFGVGGRFATASVAGAALPGSEVKNRNVTYHYASGVDKEAVSKLTVGGAGGADYARYTYYQDGGMKRRTYPGAGPGGADVAWDFLYDSDDQLKRVVKKHVTGAVETTVAIEDYLYHHDGARAVIVKRDAAGVSQEVRRFIGDQEAVLSPAGAVLETLAHVTMGTVLARVKDRVTYEHQFHGLGGSTLAAVATDGTVNTAFTYGPYGEVIEASGGQVASHRRRMNDKFQDDVSGLGYYGVRYYDQVLLGWTQGDPLYRYRPEAGWDEPRRGQLYGFVMQNPLRYVDPDGRDPKELKVVTRDLTRDPRHDKTVKRVQAAIARLGARGSRVGAEAREEGLAFGKPRDRSGVRSPAPVGSFNFFLVDLEDKGSVKAAVASSRQPKDQADLMASLLAGGKGNYGIAYPDSEDAVIAINRLTDVIERILKDPNASAAEKAEAIDNLVENVVQHESSHLAGAGHADKGLMKEEPRLIWNRDPLSDDSKREVKRRLRRRRIE